MKKKIILSMLLFAFTLTSIAETHDVYMEYHRKSKPGKQTQVNRAPMKIPVEIFYDTESHLVYIIGDEFVNAEVYLLDGKGNTEDYSSVINCEFYVSEGIHTILIQGEEWYAEGIINL